VSFERGAEVRAVEEVAMGAFERVLDQRLRSLGVRDASVELGDLALGEPTPPPASRGPGGEQPTDLCEREARVLAEANHGDAFCARGRVVPSLAGTLGDWQQANPLVVTERRSRNSGAASQFADRHRPFCAMSVP
jgi:hypothetical protein